MACRAASHWSTRCWHRPEPIGYPGLFFVGDYLFDATLNGVLDSAEIVVDCIVEAMEAGGRGKAKEA